MSSGEIKEYNIALGADFLSRIRGTHDRDYDDLSHSPVTIPPNFTIRYSAPPELLKKESPELSLRKSTRGEFIVEDASSTPDQEVGTGLEEGTSPSAGTTASATAAAAANGGGNRTKSGAAATGPRFRGPATPAQEDECVLIFNEETQSYELHLLDYNFQVAPVLKSRPRTSGSASTNQNACFLEKPAASKQQLKPTVAKSEEEPSPVKPAPSETHTSTAPSPSGSPIKSHNGLSASLHPKTSTKARLPTRRKMPPAKPKMASRATSQAPSSNAPSPTSVPTTYASEESQSTSRASTLSPPSGDLDKPPAKEDNAPELQESTDQDSDGGLDEAFNDLADALANELNEDDDNFDEPVVRSVGTAGGSANDEDVSSEEE